MTAVVQATGYGGTVAEGTVIISGTMVLPLLLRLCVLSEAGYGLVQKPAIVIAFQRGFKRLVKYTVLLVSVFAATIEILDT